MLSRLFKPFKLGVAVLFGLMIGLGGAIAADYNLRAVVGPDLNDEDYDGIVVFKDYVESRSNGAI